MIVAAFTEVDTDAVISSEEKSNCSSRLVGLQCAQRVGPLIPERFSREICARGDSSFKSMLIKGDVVFTRYVG